MNDIQLFGVTGNPVLHSKSPLMFNAEFDKQDSCYLRLACQNAGDAIDLFKKMDLKGMNVTAPFKNDIIRYLDSVSDVVSIADDDFRETPDFSDSSNISFIKKIGHIGNRMIIIIDMDSFLQIANMKI